MLRIISCVLFIFIGVGLFGQNSSFGVRAGVNRAQLMSKLNTRDAKYGMNVGFTYTHELNENNCFIIDFLYSQKGFQNGLIVHNDQGNTISEGRILNNINYFSIPLKLGHTFGKKKIIFSNFGIVPSIVLSATRFIQPGENFDNQKLDFKDEITTFDLAGVFEIGTYLKNFEKSSIFICAGINRSFINTYRNDLDYANINKHFVIDLSLGFQLNRNNQ